MRTGLKEVKRQIVGERESFSLVTLVMHFIFNNYIFYFHINLIYLLLKNIYIIYKIYFIKNIPGVTENKINYNYNYNYYL